MRKSAVAAVLSGLFSGSMAYPFLFDRASWQAFADYPYAHGAAALQASTPVIRPDPKPRPAPVHRRAPPKLVSLALPPPRRPHLVAFAEDPPMPALEPHLDAVPITPAAVFTNAMARAEPLTPEARPLMPGVAADTPAPPPPNPGAKPWHASLSASWQANSLPSAGSFGGPQLGAGITRQIAGDTGQLLSLSAAVFAGLDGSATPDPSTAQLAVGLRYRPWRGLNAVVGLDRLVKLGDRSRADWALNVAADRGINYDGVAGQAHWLHWHTAVNASIIGVAQRDIFASGQARIGIGFPLGAHWQLTPYVGAQGLLQDDGRVQSRLTVGPGLWLRGKSGATRLDARLNYVKQIAGTAQPENGLRLELGLSY